MATQPPPPIIPEQFKKLEEQLGTLMRVTTTRYLIDRTPKEVIWTLNKAKLWRYGPRVPSKKLRRVPLMFSFALMNRPSILDLRPGNSFVEYMLAQGYDLYLLDWGVPGYEDRHYNLDEYVGDYMPRAIRKIKSVSGSDEFSMLGWCIGAILATACAALYPDSGLRNLLLLTAPLDFTNREANGFTRWVNEKFFDVDRVVETFGLIPPEMIQYGAKALKPVENYIGNYLRLWDNLDNPEVVESWHAMNTWVNDNIPMTGGFFKQLIQELFRDNKLMNGTLKIRGERVDVGRIRANLLNVIAMADHITPPCESESIMDRVASEDKELFRLQGGHIGIMTGSSARKITWPHIENWLRERSD